MILSANDLSSLRQARVLVLGDLILDHYIRGTTERTSPEAPVPVVLYKNEEFIPGGAANVARNIVAAGASSCCIGLAGNDEYGELLRNTVAACGIDCTHILADGTRQTTTKTRIVSLGQQIVRLDRESATPASESVQQEIINAYETLLPHCGAVILSDYAKGVLTDRVVRTAIDMAAKAGIPLFVDPKGRHYARYRGAYALTPNAREAWEASGIQTGTDTGIREAAAEIQRSVDCHQLLITRGADGLALFRRNEEPVFLPTFAREVFDVTGAGDTFVAFLALSTAAGFTAEDSARLANAAAGVVVGKSGAATVSLSEVRSALAPQRTGRKLRTFEDMKQLGEDLRLQGKRVIFTNGCFDFLHAGHVTFMQQARTLGDALVVATNNDETITRLKGEPRPILAQTQRESMLAAIEAVDYVVTFSEPTPHQLIADLKPDILVKGSNYTLQQVEGWELVQGYGGEVKLLDVLPEISTRELLLPREDNEKNG